MKRFVILLCLVATFISFSLLFEGCKIQSNLDRKDSIINNFDSTSYIKKDSVNQLIIKQLKNRLVIIRDSLINVQLAAEKSQNKLDQILAQTDTSKLETSYAFSFAWLENGFLNHTIENKKGNIAVHTPVTTIIEKQENDTTNISNSNTQQNTNVNNSSQEIHEKDQKEVVEYTLSWKEKTTYIGIGVLIGIILALVFKVVIQKLKLKKA